MCLPYNVLRKGKILVSTFVGLRRGEGRKTAPHWSEEKMRGKVKSKKRLSLILVPRYSRCLIPELYKINISKESDVERLILLLIGRAIMNEPVNLLQTLANHALTNCRKCSSSLKSSYSVGQINKDLGSEEIRSRPTRPYSSISMHPECCSLQQRVRRPK